jgi:signal transduction histidine kinase
MKDDVTDAGELAIEEIGMGPPRLEKIVGAAALAETAASVTDLSGVAVRIFSSSGAQLAGGPLGAAVRAQAEALLRGVKVPAEVRDESGSRYRLLPVEYDGRSVGGVVLGPYALSEDGPSAAGPMLTAKTLSDLCRHLTRVLDLVMWSGHKALLTSTMHLASMRESFRELAEKNEKLNEAYERLKELDRLKSNFIATVSHELRTPLTSIMGYSEMLAEGIAGQLNQEQADFIATIRTKSDQLLGLIVSLLDMSKLESGTFFVRPEPVSIVSLLADVVSTLTPTANKKGVRLSVEGDDGALPPVRGDADRLRQVFLNLTENAVKFTPSGGCVTLSAVEGIDPRDHEGVVLVAPVHRAVEVRVADTGVGIPRGERDRVFAPFYQVDQSSTREQGGTGLGLAIVKRLVDAHNGMIRIEDNEPRGTVFVVTLPGIDGTTLASPPGDDAQDGAGDGLPSVFS